MLLNHTTAENMTDHLYNPLNHLTQNELMEKFNLAFYEAQTISKNDLLQTLNEPTNETTVEKTSDNVTNVKNCDANLDNVKPIADTYGKTIENRGPLLETNDDYLIDYLISEECDNRSPAVYDEISFDFNEFVANFDENVNDVRLSLSDSSTTTSGLDFDTETFTTENSENDDNGKPCGQFSQFFIPPPLFHCETAKTEPKMCDFDQIDLCEVLTTATTFLENLPQEFRDIEEEIGEYDGCYNGDSNVLPPVGTITKNNMDFNSYIRSVPGQDLGYFSQDTTSKNEFGHLIGTKKVNNNFLSSAINVNIICERIVEKPEICNVFSNDENYAVVSQSDALMNDDDPLLSSGNLLYSKRRDHHPVESYDYENDCEEITSSTTNNLQCKWEGCYQTYESQSHLVKHIEKCHVELKRGDEFTCFWEKCPRKIKPFNARYKLLIHMRVHSGEKPNKCPFQGCNKAFSRLENLKIHQRSHTGERPYLCQFSSCTKSFSNSSDRAKHQRTHFDTKPYACQVIGCHKKYTDPSSLRKHVKNHTYEEQMQIKKKTTEDHPVSPVKNAMTKKFLDQSKQKAIKSDQKFVYYKTNYDHSYSNTFLVEKKYDTINIKQDLKNKISEKNKLKRNSIF